MANGERVEVGATLKRGALVLLTSGEYSDYLVRGLYRVEADIVVPGKAGRWRPDRLRVDLEALSVALTEVEYVEVWRSDD